MTDNDTPSTFPWFHLPDRLKLGLQRLGPKALESLQNLRAFEYTGLTLSQGRTFVLGPTPSNDVIHFHILTDRRELAGIAPSCCHD
jgi:hypothetical protein